MAKKIGKKLFAGLTEKQKISAMLALVVIGVKIAEDEGIKVDNKTKKFAKQIINGVGK